MPIRKRNFAKFVMNRLDLSPYIERLHNIVEEIAYDKVPEDEVNRRIVELSTFLSNHGQEVNRNFKRFGSINDGGYCLVDLIEEKSKLLSFGVGDDVSFERDLSSSISAIHLYDHSVDCLPIKIENGTFFQLGLASRRYGDFITLADAIIEIGEASDLLLKMDIEGYEREVLSAADSNDLAKFSQIVIEFHGLHRIFEDEYYAVFVNALKKLRSTHSPVIVHANNFGDYKILGNVPVPDVIEVTYLRNGFIDSRNIHDVRAYKRSNNPNNPSRPAISLSFLDLENQPTDFQ